MSDVIEAKISLVETYSHQFNMKTANFPPRTIFGLEDTGWYIYIPLDVNGNISLKIWSKLHMNAVKTKPQRVNTEAFLRCRACSVALIIIFLPGTHCSDDVCTCTSIKCTCTCSHYT